MVTQPSTTRTALISGVAAMTRMGPARFSSALIQAIALFPHFCLSRHFKVLVFKSACSFHYSRVFLPARFFFFKLGKVWDNMNPFQGPESSLNATPSPPGWLCIKTDSSVGHFNVSLTEGQKGVFFRRKFWRVKSIQYCFWQKRVFFQSQLSKRN